jgi:hypothetical protein
MSAATWSFTLSRATGENVGPLTAARARKLSFFLDSAATAAFTMPGEHPETASVVELATDVVCSRNGVNLFRGRLGNSSDTLAADQIDTALSAIDYRGMLGRRIMWFNDTRSWRGADQADIAWQMIADTQALPGGALGITRGAAAATGTLRDRDYDPGKNVGEALSQLGECQGGFDWEIDASRRFNLYYPQRGRATGLVLTYGRDIVALTRTLDASVFANAIRYTGSATTTADEVSVSTWDPEIGRWDGQKSDPNLILQTTLDQAAAGELADASTLSPAFSVTLAAGAWDPAQIWVGDTVRLIVQSGRLNVDTTRRIVQIDVTLSDDGDETVVLSVAAAQSTLTARLVSYNSRINNLERAAGYIPDVPVGAMYDWPGTTPPALTMWADGSVLNIAQYPELHTAIGNTYGGDGVTTFALPDCRGRMTVAAGAGTGLTARSAGQKGGAETVQLSAAATGPHNHGFGGATQAESGNHAHDFGGATQAEAGDHNHAFTATSSTESAAHQHGLGFAWSQIAATAAASAFNAIVAGANSSGTNITSHTHGVAGTSQGKSASHTHPIVPGTTGLETATHTHPINPGFTDNGGTTGAAHENMPPWIAIGKVIKVMSPQNAG